MAIECEICKKDMTQCLDVRNSTYRLRDMSEGHREKGGYGKQALYMKDGQ